MARFVHVKLPLAARVALVLSALSLTFGLGLLLAAPTVGRFLVVADPLAPADAVFVLDGSTPSRELQAAALFHLKLAPSIVLPRARDPFPVARQLAGEPTPQERSARVLAHVGVPPAAVLRLDRPVENSADELAVDFEYARARGFRRVILVTSPAHTRRVRVIWDRRYQAAMPALVRPTSYEAWDPERWWRSRRSLESGLHELAGIAHFLIGSPIPTFDRRP